MKRFFFVRPIFVAVVALLAPAATECQLPAARLGYPHQSTSLTTEE